MRLHYASTQVAGLVALGAMTVVIVAMFVAVARSSRRDVPFDRVRDVGYRARRWWFALLVIAVVGSAGLSVVGAPYASGSGGHVVHVVGRQFGWSLDRTRFKVHESVVFDVTSGDVNHGFGLYDPRGEMIGSVQAMPGYHNKLAVTLDEVGRYTIACLEFCGFDHHIMMSSFQVTR